MTADSAYSLEALMVPDTQGGWGEILSRARDSALLRSEGVVLFVGLLLVCLAPLWIWIGKVRTRYDGWVYRAQESKEFWLNVVMYFLSGMALISYFAYKLCIANAD